MGDSEADKKHLYKVLYNVHRPDAPITREEIPEGWGAADAVAITSVIKSDQGDSFLLVSLDGDTGSPSTIEDLFRYWLIWAEFLKEALPTADPRRTLCQAVSSAVVEALQEPKETRKPINN